MSDGPAAAPRHGGATVRFLGHATFELDLGVATACSPTRSCATALLFLRRDRRPRPVPPGRGPPDGAVLVSHLHHDHLDLPLLSRLGPAVGSLLVPRGSERFFPSGTGSPTPCRSAPGGPRTAWAS